MPRRWLLLAGLLACDPVPLGEGERLKVVRGLHSEVIEPQLERAHARAGALATSLGALATTPDATTMIAARDAWRAARLAWKALGPLQFGPATTLGTKDAIDWFPVEAKKLEEVVAGMDPLTAQSIGNLGTNRRGYHAIELLLFAGADPLAALTGDDPLVARRRRYLVALGQDVLGQIITLRTAWTEHAPLFTNPGHAPSPYPSVRASLDAVVNETVTAAETGVTKLSKPLGLLGGGELRPELEESAASDNTLDELAANLAGVRAVLIGAGATGISPIVRSKSPGLDLRVRAALDRADAVLAAVPRPLRAALLAKDPRVAAAYEGLRDLKRLLATELVATLGATIKFNDNDGD